MMQGLELSTAKSAYNLGTGIPAAAGGMRQPG